MILATAMTAALGVPACATAQSTIEQIAAKLLGDKFGTTAQLILSLSRSSNQSVFDLAPAYSVSRQTRHPADEVMRLRRQGLGWGEIAHRLNMNPGTFNKLRTSGAFDRDLIWNSIYRNHYGMRDSDFTSIRRRGGSERDVLPAILIARSSRTSPLTVYNRYRQDGDWDRTSNAYQYDLRIQRKRSVKSVVKGHGHANGSENEKRLDERRGNSSSNRKDHGKGDGEGHGNGHGKGHGKGDDEGHGNGHGNGHGKGNDEGHGKGDD